MRIATAALALAAISCAPGKPGVPYPVSEPPEGDPLEADTPAVEAPASVATYFDRRVDLRPFLSGFPYTRFMPSLRTGEVFYLEMGETYALRRVSMPAARGAPLNLAGGDRISDADWSKRSLWDAHHQRGTSKVWLHADARNDERMNLWTLDLDQGKLEPVTDHDYVYGFGFDAADQRVAYLPRTGTAAPYSTCLHLLTPATGKDDKILCDRPELRFTWGSPRFSPDGQTVYFNAQVDGDRNRVQLVKVELGRKKPRAVPVTDPKRPRSSPTALEGWVDDDLLLFRANDDGFTNLHSYSRSSGKTRQLTRFTEDMTSARLTDAGVLAVHRTPAGSTLVLVDPRSGKVLDSQELPGSADVMDAHGTTALVRQESPDIVFEAFRVTLEGGKIEKTRVVALPEALAEQAVACKATAVKIPTFDRELHAFRLDPRNPLEDDAQRLALIRSFYGGANAYDVFDQILCAAGFTVISPSVRGSSGFGKEFHALNDGDLGGDEIVDLFYVARWAEQALGLPPRRIGVYGRSHGGYATMRALTYPPQTNGRNESYPLGFGMSDAGFSDIETFHDATNIPDWVVLESGDPARPEDLARMKDRSPLSHVDRLQAPLLVTHGSNDWRVPVEESRQFVREARALDKPVQYVEFEGQGHHVEGLELRVQAWQVRFDFLQAVAKAAPSP